MGQETNISLDQLYKSLQTFERLSMAAENRDKIYRYQDALMQSLWSILEDQECDEAAKMTCLSQTLEQYAAAMKALFPVLISNGVQKAEDPAPEDPPQEEPPEPKRTIGKSDPDRFDEIQEVEKFNPYHDRLGRFATADGFMNPGYSGDKQKQAVTFSADPKTKAGANAIARESDGETGHEIIGGAYGTKEPAKNPKKPEPKKPEPQSEFTPATSKKEAIQYAQKELGFQKVSYGTKLDLDTINHINQQIHDIQAKYPETKGAVQEIKTSQRSGMYAAIQYWNGGEKMAFLIGAKQYAKGMDAVEKSYERDVKAGFHPKGTTAKDIVWHEYGHVIDFQSRATKGVGSSKWISEAAATMETKPFEVAKGISRYAQKNVRETFAEAFAEFNGSKNPSPECIAIMKAAGIFK